MATLSQQLVGGAQAAQTQAGNSVGDAIQAYHVAATAEHARQSLDIQKQENERNKGNWVISQLDALGRMSGPAQNVALDSFARQYKQINPSFNEDNLQIMKKDPEILKSLVGSAGQALSGGGLTSESASALHSMLGGDAASFAAAAEKIGQQRAMIKAAQFKGEAQAQRGFVMQDNQTAAAVKRVTDNPVLNQYAQRIDGVGRMKSQLEEMRAGHIVDTPQFLADLNQEYMNLLTGQQGAALGKLERTEYTSLSSDIASIRQKFNADPTSINSPKILQQLERGIDSLDKNYRTNYEKRINILPSLFPHNPAAMQEQQRAKSQMLEIYGNQNGPAPRSAAMPMDQSPPVGAPQQPPADNYEHMTDPELKAAFKLQTEGKK